MRAEMIVLKITGLILLGYAFYSCNTGQIKEAGFTVNRDEDPGRFQMALWFWVFMGLMLMTGDFWCRLLFYFQQK
jgi:hypothetical protein